MAASEPDFVLSTPDEVDATRAENWLRGVGKLAPRYRCVPVTADVVDFLSKDGLLLPPVPPSLPVLERDPRFERATDADALSAGSDADGGEDGGASDSGSELEAPPPLEDFQRAVAAAMDEVGPMVMPRLSWITPWDGAWMNGGEAQCGSVGEVLTVLKASDLVTEAIFGEGRETGAADAVPEPGAPNSSLVLVDFASLDATPGSMFRAFVVRGRVVAVSQLRHGVYLPAAVENRGIAAASAAWIAERVRAHPVETASSAEPVTLSTFTVDFSAVPSGRAHLLDLAPLRRDTDALLFSIEELQDAAAAAEAGTAGAGSAGWSPEVRVVRSDEEATPGLARRVEDTPMPAELAMLMAGAGGTEPGEGGGEGAGGAAGSLEAAIRMARAYGAAKE